MQTISLKSNTASDFYKHVEGIFNHGKLKKVEKKIIKWETTIAKINSLLYKKLKKYDDTISLEKLIKAEYVYIKGLIDFIDKNPAITRLTNEQKDYFLTLYSRLDKPWFIDELNMKVCPYCNRNYIFNFLKANKKNATAQLDHFFDKGTYPYLAVTMYNLVPSCSTCNQRKSNKKCNIFYPYLESFSDSVKFKYDGIKSLSYFHNQGLDFFEDKRVMFHLEPIKDEAKAKEHIRIFNLESLYAEHKDTVAELLQKRVIYSDSYIDELFKQYEGVLFKNREDLLRLITCGYITDEELGKRPLSKLIKDISKELGLS